MEGTLCFAHSAFNFVFCEILSQFFKSLVSIVFRPPVLCSSLLVLSAVLADYVGVTKMHLHGVSI